MYQTDKIKILKQTKYLCLGLVFSVVFLTNTLAFASVTDGTIAGGGNNGYAWSNIAGWVNFATSNGNLRIANNKITGYAWNNNYGWINMSPTNGGVSVAGDGTLSGYAWGQSLGWINFSGVSINSSGEFTGQATGDAIGILTFDCTNCIVVTDYVPQDYSTPETTTNDTEGNITGRMPLRTTSLEGIPTPSDIDTDTFPPGVGDKGEIGTDWESSSESELPTGPFDIRLLLDVSTISHLSSLVARVAFDNFGSETTSVDMTFSINDVEGNEIWSGKDQVVFETEYMYVKYFSDEENLPQLPDGEYTLRLHTLYNSNIEDDFEVNFTVDSGLITGLPTMIWVVSGSLLILLLILFVIVKRRNTLSLR